MPAGDVTSIRNGTMNGAVRSTSGSWATAARTSSS